jgi:hypothetical protein
MRVIQLPSTPLQWLIVAAALHVITALICFLFGHFAILPQVFDTDGLATGIAFDNTIYRSLQFELVETLRGPGLQAWLHYQSPLHSKLYSLSFALFGKIFGYNILATEPLNLIYFLVTLSFVYLIGREIFSARAGLLAAVIAGLWPSMLLQSTQIIRDPLSNACLLGTIWLLTVLVARELTWRQSFLWLVATILTIALLWLVRGNMWTIVMVALAATIAFIVVRNFKLKRVVTPNAIALLVLFAVSIIIPTQLESKTLQDRKSPVAALSLQSIGGEMDPFTRLVKQIGYRRAAFHSGFAAKASNIDADVQLLSVGDIVKYLPRATVVGFLAPFPSMWFQVGGEVGRKGRLASGFEMILIYLVYAAALVGLWLERRRLPMWLSAVVAAAGIVGLGLIVANVGALYRLRYAFWMLLVVIAAQGILLTLEKRGWSFD